MQNKKENMETMRAYKFRLYPDAKRQKAIDDAVSISQRLYNKLLEKTIDAHKKNPSSKISQRTINQFLNGIIKEDKEYLQLYAHVRVDIRNRLLKTYQNFFRRCQQKKSGANIKAGFPRFKSKDRFNSITHIENNGSFRFEKSGNKNMLRISKIGRVQIEQHRNMVGNVKTMTIKREGRKYYAIFTAEQIVNPPKVEDTNPVGMDMGLNNFVALSDGKTIQKPKFFKQKEKRIAKWQRIIARREKKSKRRQKAKERLQNEWNGITNQSNDFAHKLSHELANAGYTSFAVERLEIQNMQKNHRLAQSIQNASWNRFIQMLSYKAESAGMSVVKVDARNTSKECSNCGNITDMPLSMREYNCDRCGLRLDRDINASINILKRGRAGLARTYAQGDNVRLQQEAVVKELGTNPVNSGEANGI
jgi:putative transposase